MMKNCELDYADDLICLRECTENAQSGLYKLASIVALFGTFQTFRAESGVTRM